LLDFKSQSFNKQKIKTDNKFPSKFRSVQTLDGRIFIVGGILKEQVYKGVFLLDCNLYLQEMATMKQGRFNAPTLLIKDSFIITAGGHINLQNATKSTNSVELYDIKTDIWHNLN